MNGPLSRELAKEAEKVKLKALTFQTVGWKQTASDFKGCKTRTTLSPSIMEQYRSDGASPVPIACKELHNALQLGTMSHPPPNSRCSRTLNNICHSCAENGLHCTPYEGEIRRPLVETAPQRERR